MRISNFFSAAAASAALLAAAPVLAGEAPANDGWRQVAYSCESGQELTVGLPGVRHRRPGPAPLTGRPSS